MPELLLISKGNQYTCLYDQEDSELISRFSWYLNSNGYAITSIEGKTVLMHRLILGLQDPKTFGDHKDGNRLNNCRSNIRTATASENRRNSQKEKNCTSIYKGSYFESDRGLYHSQIGMATKNGTKVYNLGRYHQEKMAAKAYDKRAVQLFGEFAYVNFASSKESSQLTFPWI